MRNETFEDVQQLFKEFNQIESSGKGKVNRKLDNRRQIEDMVEQKRLEHEIDYFCDI